MKKVTLPIHVVMGQSSQECSNPLRAFATELGASSFVALCRAHDSIKPACPHIEETPENDQLHEAWWAAYRKWQACHPGGADAVFCDDYVVVPLPFETTVEVKS